DIANACAGFDAHLEMLAAALEGVPIHFPVDHYLEARRAYQALQREEPLPARHASAPSALVTRPEVVTQVGDQRAAVADRGREWALCIEDAASRWDHSRHFAPGILPCALRASLRLSKIAPGDFVEPEDFIARLAALVPKPRAHQIRYHGRCGGRLHVIASIEAPTTIERILAHLGRDAEPVDPAYPSRAPPQGDLSF